MKDIVIGFISQKIKEEYSSLQTHKFEDKQLYTFISRAFEDLKRNPTCGVKISKKLWPKDYKRLEITNLWKYDLPNAWRLIYTIESDDVLIVAIVLEWFSHKEYERKFKY